MFTCAVSMISMSWFSERPESLAATVAESPLANARSSGVVPLTCGGSIASLGVGAGADATGAWLRGFQIEATRERTEGISKATAIAIRAGTSNQSLRGGAR